MSRLPRLAVAVPERAVPATVAAFETVCEAVSFLRRDERGELWSVEGILRDPGRRAELDTALALAAAASGIAPPEVATGEVEVEGWLARTRAAFPPQPIGQRFLIR
ncbi:MAG: hypothetical protein KJ025_23935, partial [Burkholderiales bacterium]|nr:hypothetical protein [Burkholderiales bacterium]